jgi:hypothetical protein
MSFQRPHLQRELDALPKSGFTYRMLDNDLIELADPVSGEKHLKSLREPSEAAIRVWAASRGVPILEIDPTQIDTNKYAGWYAHWAEVPLSNSEGIPLVVDDVDRNGKPEVYGAFCDFTSQDFEARIYEVDSGGTTQFRYRYVPRPGVSRVFTDVDRDSSREVLWSLGGGLYDYEQVVLDSLPTQLGFVHQRYRGMVSPGFTGIFVGSLDEDSLTDLLYKGSEPDSTNPNGITKVYVAEYNPDSVNFVRVWSNDYGFNGNVAGIGGFAVDDFDGDGKTEFVLSDLTTGKVFVTESVRDNSFEVTWHDSTPFVNLYYLTSGDVDGDGRPEFFVGATMSNGNWTLVYEADSNNSYSLQFLFHLMAGGVLDSPTYLTTDVNGDGKPELVVFSGPYLFVFTARTNNNYILFYLKRETNRHSVQFCDLNGDGIKDFLVSKDEFDTLGRFRFKADVYKGTSLVHVGEELVKPTQTQLLQNYPNPFNPWTTIRYALPQASFVTLTVYNALGQQVAQLVNEQQQGGYHDAVFRGDGLASGVYFYRMQAGNFVQTKKLLLLK